MDTARTPRVFLSRTTKGLGPLAERVAAVLSDRGYEVVHQPDFGMEWRKIRHMLMDRLRACDSVLCLVGKAYGFAPPAEVIPEFADAETGRTEFSYTQLEYLIARRLHKPVITVLLRDDFPFAPFEQTEREAQLQQEFVRDYVTKGEHVYHGYATEAALLEALRAAVIPLTTSLLPEATPENIPFKSIGTLFRGRTEALRSLRENLRGGALTKPAVQLIHGLGGVGKTRLAVEFAHAHVEDYTARLFVRGASPGALEESLAGLCGLFVLNLEEQDERETDVRVAAVVQWLAAHPGYLLVIDNVDTEPARDAVAELLPRLTGADGHVLVTSRLHTWPGDMLRMPLDVLSDADGAAVLLGYRASPKAPVPDADGADALALARDLDGLSLALEQAAAYLNAIACTIAEYHERWRQNQARVRAWHDPAQMGYPQSVATTWLTSFEQLGEAARTMLRMLSWFAPDPIPRTLLKQLDDRVIRPDPLDGADSRKALGELMNFSLARPAAGGRAFALHRLVQEVTRGRQLDGEGSTVGQPRGRLGRWLGRVLRSVAGGGDPHASPVDLEGALAWVNGEFPAESTDVRTWPVAEPLVPHAIAVGNFAADHGLYDRTERLLNAVGAMLMTKAQYRAAEPLLRRALAVSEAWQGRNGTSVAMSLTNLAVLLRETNRLAEAETLMRRALAIDERSQGARHPATADGLTNLAQLLKATGRLAEAEPLMRRALAIAEARLGREHPQVAANLSNLALLCLETERAAEAEALLRRAVAIGEDHFGRGHPAVARYADNLAQVLQRRGKVAEAEPLVRAALAAHEAALGDEHPDVATSLNNLAGTHIAAGRPADAEPLMRRALAIFEKMLGPEHPKVALLSANLGALLQLLKRYDEAEPLLRRALAIDEATLGADDAAVAESLTDLARLLFAAGRFAEAEPVLRRGLAADEARLGPEADGVGVTLFNLVQLLAHDGRWTEAEPLMERCLEIVLRISATTGKPHARFHASVDAYRQVLEKMGLPEAEVTRKLEARLRGFGTRLGGG